MSLKHEGFQAIKWNDYCSYLGTKKNIFDKIWNKLKNRNIIYSPSALNAWALGRINLKMGRSIRKIYLFIYKMFAIFKKWIVY